MAILTTYGQFRTTFAIDTTVANDGYLRWPIEKVYADFVGITRPTSTTFVILPMTIHGEGVLTADAVYGEDDYDWFLSQRTDVAADQLLSITQYASTSTNTYSGSVQIDATALGTSLYPGVSEDSLLGLFRHVDLYVRRRSDQQIQHMRPLDTLLGMII